LIAKVNVVIAVTSLKRPLVLHLAVALVDTRFRLIKKVQISVGTLIEALAYLAKSSKPFLIPPMGSLYQAEMLVLTLPF
jgi:hypothetical protein